MHTRRVLVRASLDSIALLLAWRYNFGELENAFALKALLSGGFAEYGLRNLHSTRCLWTTMLEQQENRAAQALVAPVELHELHD